MLFCLKEKWRNCRLSQGKIAWLVWGVMAMTAVVLMLCTATDAQAQPVVSDELLRLHVVANSDSNEDQAVKLRVRDAIQREFAATWQDVGDGAACRLLAQRALPEIERCAQRVLAENGFSYTAKAQLGVFPFPQRIYEDVVTLPEGRYWAVRVTLGEGEGQNWWCVLYPPLCMSSRSEDETLAIKSWLWENLPEHWRSCLIRFWTGEETV